MTTHITDTDSTVEANASGASAENTLSTAKGGSSGTAPQGARRARPGLLAAGLSVVLLAVVAVFAVIGHKPMLDLARAQQRSRVTVRVFWPEMPPQVVKRARAKGVTGPITWMDPDSQGEIVKVVERIVSDDPFDFASLQEAQQALTRTGWFASPVRLSRQGSGLVEVHGRWRVPFAAVRVGDDDRIVTRQGELLSPVYRPDGSKLKLVLGAQLTPPELGETWLGGDVQAGLALLDFLRPMPGYEQVYGVDVGTYQQDKTLTIVTVWGTRVTWGGHPEQFNPGQPAGTVRRARLAAVAQKHGRIDAGRAMLDLRSEDGVYIIAPPELALAPSDDPGSPASGERAANSTSPKPRAPGRTPSGAGRSVARATGPAVRGSAHRH